MAVAEYVLIDNIVTALRAAGLKQAGRTQTVKEFRKGQPPEDQQLAVVPCVTIDLVDGGDERNLTSDSNIASVPIEIVAWVGGRGADSDKRAAIELLNDCLKALETQAAIVGIASNDFAASQLSIVWHMGATGARKVVSYEMNWARDAR